MTEAMMEYARGDWVVHKHYGVGQIKGIEKKVLNGKKTTFYKVSTKNSTFWIPLDQVDCDRLRPLASINELNQAIRVLRNPPREMAPDHNDRKRRIKTIKSDGSLVSMARLIRDLWARRRMKKRLNATEERALDRLQDRLLTEWSVCKNIKFEEAQDRLRAMLERSSIG